MPKEPNMATATKLPFHFCWRNGAVTETLDAALACLEGNADDAAWHLSEGHLQHALGTQGYEALVEGVRGAGELGVLRDRARIASSSTTATIRGWMCRRPSARWPAKVWHLMQPNA